MSKKRKKSLSIQMQKGVFKVAYCSFEIVNELNSKQCGKEVVSKSQWWILYFTCLMGNRLFFFVENYYSYCTKARLSLNKMSKCP